MGNYDHKTGNYIHPTAIISGAVLGTNNYIGPYCVIGAGVKIGDKNRFEAHCSIGMPAEKHGYFEQGAAEVHIGDDNIFREFVTVNGGTGKLTSIRHDCVFLKGSHVGHDSVVEDDVTVSCNVLIGGESYVMIGANLGLGAILHQRTLIGSYAMIGMGAVVTKRKEVKPGEMWVGNPAKFLKVNKVGISRFPAMVGYPSLDSEHRRWLSLKDEVWGS